MRKLLHGLLVLGMAGATVLFVAGEAAAACPFFTVYTDVPVTQEGAKVTVTVSKRGGSGTVDLNTVSGSATAGSDFRPLDEKVQFGSANARAFNVPIINDDLKEGEETFKVHLSNPQGCDPEGQPDENFVSDDRTVKIVASDQSAQGSPSPTTGPTASPAPTETASSTSSPGASPSPSPSVSPSPSPSPTLTPIPLATLSAGFDDEDDDGISSLGLAGIVIGGLAAMAAVTSLFWWRRRY